MKKRKNKENEALEAKIDELEEKIKELESVNLVKLAELENSRKRLEREFDNQRSFANEKIILNFLEILDNLERALLAKGDISQGVEMIKKQFINTLEKESVERISTEHFDPELHQAVEIAQGEKDAIIEVRPGYKLKNKVIRPALVKLIKEEA